jgi:hypothetical protein
MFETLGIPLHLGWRNEPHASRGPAQHGVLARSAFKNAELNYIFHLQKINAVGSMNKMST